MQFYLITALLFSLLVAIFAIQNTETTVIHFLTWQTQVSLVLVILGSAAVGALTLYLLSLVKQVGAWMKIRQITGTKTELEKQVKALEARLASLHPAQDSKTTGGSAAGNAVVDEKSQKSVNPGDHQPS